MILYTPMNHFMKKIQRDFGISFLFISHDLSVVEYICDRIIVMYLGKVMEIAKRDDLYKNPAHPYTQALLSAIPIPDPTVKKERILLEGDTPSPVDPPVGCRYCTRCANAKEICKTQEPVLKEIEDGHLAACHFV